MILRARKTWLVVLCFNWKKNIYGVQPRTPLEWMDFLHVLGVKERWVDMSRKH